MNEQLISFETAKLAKEKGFDLLTELCYIEDDKVAIPYGLSLLEKYKSLESYATLTQSLLQRWLREVHKVHVCTDIDINSKWSFSLHSLNSKRNSEIPVVFNHHLTYEEALEEGLKQALLLIKKEN